MSIAKKNSENLKVLHISTGLNLGGAEVMLARLIEHSRNPENHVVVSLLPPGEVARRIENAGAKVYSLNLHGKNPFSFKAFSIFKILRRFNPDIVQGWMFHGNLFAAFAAFFGGYKHVFWSIHHVGITKSDNLRLRIVEKICAIVSHFTVEGVLCCAKSSIKARIKAGYNSKTLDFIPNGYECDNFRKDSVLGGELRKKSGISPDSFVIAHAGRISYPKNHIGLVRSFAMIKKARPDALLLLAGKDTDTDQALSGEIKKLGLGDSVVRLGIFRDMLSFYNAADMTIMSSVTEGFPNVVCESMLCEKVCASSDVGDAAFIIDNSKLIAPIGDDAALANAALYFINLPESEKLLLGKKARLRIAENFDIEKVCSMFYDKWLGVL